MRLAAGRQHRVNLMEGSHCFVANRAHLFRSVLFAFAQSTAIIGTQGNVLITIRFVRILELSQAIVPHAATCVERSTAFKIAASNVGFDFLAVKTFLKTKINISVTFEYDRSSLDIRDV